MRLKLARTMTMTGSNLEQGQSCKRRMSLILPPSTVTDSAHSPEEHGEASGVVRGGAHLEL
jgi:hypothetical protein